MGKDSKAVVRSHLEGEYVGENREVPIGVQERVAELLNELVPAEGDKGFLVDAPPVLNDAVLETSRDM